MENSKFENEIMKELDREKEKEILEYTINVIKKEILAYIGKRKDLGEYILEYRKNVLDEYRDDEDKIIEYFDHERFVKEEAFKSIDRRLKEMLILENSPYFGRVDFTEEEYDSTESIYIGRFGITPEGTYDPLVIDWRAPIAALFYSGKLGSAQYKAPMGEIDVDILTKRQYIIKRAKLLGFFDSAVDVKDEILQMVLSNNSSDKLKDIIMTIQEEQDNIIRQPYNRTMVVNGVAGSGKTTIALHRVAYLLYNYREKLQDKVLILGPNSIFMEYISMVLPSLGEVGVKQKTFKDYAMNLLDIDDIMPLKDYMEKIFSKDENFIHDIIYKNSVGFIDVLDNLINSTNEDYFKYEDVYLMDDLVIDKTETMELFKEHYSNMPLFRRSKKIRRIIFSKIKDKRDEEIREIEKEFREQKEALTPKELELHLRHLEFVRKNKIRDVIRAVLQTKEKLNWLNNPSFIQLYNDLNGNKELTYDDLAPLLYLNLRLNGKGKLEEIKHVVIDEAQDYSLLQFKVIKELTGCLSMTIVGDGNQRLIPYEGAVPMIKLDKDTFGFEVDHYKLEKSYRSTQQIMDHANSYIKNTEIIPLVRSGNEVKVESCSSYSDAAASIKNLVDNIRDKGHESIAIICKNTEALNLLRNNFKDNFVYKVMDDEEKIYSGNIVLIPSYYAKGLEFDAAVIVETDDENTNYVMCTRALHELAVIRIK